MRVAFADVLPGRRTAENEKDASIKDAAVSRYRFLRDSRLRLELRSERALDARQIGFRESLPRQQLRRARFGLATIASGIRIVCRRAARTRSRMALSISCAVFSEYGFLGVAIGIAPRRGEGASS